MMQFEPTLGRITTYHFENKLLNKKVESYFLQEFDLRSFALDPRVAITG